MNSEVWIGTIEISYVSADDPGSLKRAFTVVTTWATSLEEFTQRCNDMLETYGWKLLGVEKANPLPDDSSFVHSMTKWKTCSKGPEPIEQRLFMGPFTPTLGCN
jgi:hypothetical protein